MRYALGATAAIVLLLALGACSLVDMVRYSVAEYAARGVMVECALATAERQANLAAVNGWLATTGAQARAVSLDCDGDGSSDF